ncbi:HET-domain-containing protein [Pleurostoma richardsiae]|uniref:HET-domain-containing protein n=1 Tax=Pleurostoma richardsiae TaxID=41990 RepID=A0AA38VHG8_9PEZI|nr:HET-domain-containing protein [Pleurostoma richardsiae]
MELIDRVRNVWRGPAEKPPPVTSTTDNSAPAFQYEPLRRGWNARHFRLLKLMPGGLDEPPAQCEIFHSILDDYPPYEALSYVWGDENITTPIIVNGVEHEVTVNLALALRYLRYADRERILWVDALCINQKDIPEKSFQVGMMREIYLGAETVLAWLGEEGSTMEAIRYCETLPPAKGRIIPSPDEVPTPSQRQACDDLFFNRPYWKRMWVIQEICHGREVAFYTGCVGIHIEAFVECFLRYTKVTVWERRQNQDLQEAIYDMLLSALEENPIASALDHRPDEWASWRKTEPMMHLLEMLHKFRPQNSGDPRDKIFALLWIAGKKCGVKPDYSLTKEEVYLSVTRKFLQGSTHPFLMVESVNREIRSTPEMPSWAPDFSDRQRVFPRLMWLYYKAFSANRFDPRQVRKAFGPSKLKARSIVLRSVLAATITGVFRTGAVPNETREEYKIALIRYDRRPTSYHRRDNPDPWPAVEEGGEEISWKNTSWGPYRAEVGDIIIVTPLSNIPMVLRRREGDGYLFVGMCWLIDSRITPGRFETDPGFSDIMRGSIWDDVGRTRVVEMFEVY